MVKMICFFGNLILFVVCMAMFLQFIREKESKFSCFMAGYMMLMALVNCLRI